MKIKHAEFKRVLEREGKLCADVEVSVQGEGDKGDNEEARYVVLFTETRDQDFDMVMILRKDAEYDVDWYDNDLHSAYIDVTDTLLQNEAGDTVLEQMKKDILSYGSIREQIAQHLEEARALQA